MRALFPISFQGRTSPFIAFPAKNLQSAQLVARAGTRERPESTQPSRSSEGRGTANFDPKLTFPMPLFLGHPSAAQAIKQFTIGSEWRVLLDLSQGAVGPRMARNFCKLARASASCPFSLSAAISANQASRPTFCAIASCASVIASAKRPLANNPKARLWLKSGLGGAPPTRFAVIKFSKASLKWP
jgi:hypothetical protein